MLLEYAFTVTILHYAQGTSRHFPHAIFSRPCHASICYVQAVDRYSSCHGSRILTFVHLPPFGDAFTRVNAFNAGIGRRKEDVVRQWLERLAMRHLALTLAICGDSVAGVLPHVIGER